MEVRERRRGRKKGKVVAGKVRLKSGLRYVCLDSSALEPR